MNSEQLTKRCAMCDEDLPYSQFGKGPRMKLGLKSYCRACCAVDARRRYQANPEHYRKVSSANRRAKYTPEAGRRRHLRQMYGLTWDQYSELLAEQHGCCAICGVNEPGGKGDWHVDHCHGSSAVRGLLCSNCNVGLGMFADEAERLQAAANYVRRNSI
jgi:hypothetical protein